jgi:Tol biopolymer transport system component
VPGTTIVPVSRLRWLPALLLLVAFLVVPATASATLAFVRNPLKPQVWVAEDNGKRAHRLVPGTDPSVSPDGRIVALLHQGTQRNAQPELVLAPADGSAPASTLLKGWRDPKVFAWSPDGSTIAALRGPEVGERTLALIDVTSAEQLVVAKGYFQSVSFDPDGGALVYGRAPSEDFPPRSDVYRFDVPPPGAVFVQAPQPQRLTNDHRSLSPLWGPTGKIVFVKQLGAKQRRYGPKNELYLMNPAGKQVRRLTHTKVAPLLQGLYPTAWSGNGRRLLAQFYGQDTTYAVTVNPRTGAQRPLVEATEQGLAGAALSANGKQVLGATGGFEPGPGHDVVTVPYGGGKLRVLAKNAFEPDWSR